MSSPSVARIAYLASDSVIDVLPPLPDTSPFASTYTSLSKSSRATSRLISIPSGGDPLSVALQQHNPSLISVTASATSKIILNIVLRLSELSSLPIVLHFILEGDLSDVLLLRSAIPYFLLSSTSQQAHDNSLIASKLARSQRKPVVHAFYAGPAGGLEELADDKIVPFLLEERAASPAANGHANGNGDATDTNGSAGTNGHTNGHAGANGHTNGNGNHHLDPHEVLFKAYESLAASAVALLRRPIRYLQSSGSSTSETVIFTLGRELMVVVDDILVHSISLVNPLPTSRILAAIPLTAKRVIVLEDIARWSMKWTPLYLDVIRALQHRDANERPIVQSGLLGNVEGLGAADVLQFVQNASSTSSSRLELGSSIPSSPTPVALHIPKHEASYTKVLSHLFSERLDVVNSPSLIASQGSIATTPEFALGRVRGQLEERSLLVTAVEELLQSPSVDADLHSLLSQWLIAKDDAVKSRKLTDGIVSALSASSLGLPASDRILSLKAHLPARSRWIIGSDAWSYDLGASGLHHLIASGLNVNILIIDNLPYSSRNSGDPSRRKRDVGLYAMNHGDVFVASVAVYSSYAQVLQSFIEADKYTGPSVVLAHLPYESDASPALDVLKETKLAVDSGYWPLYRWDPSKEREGKEPFSLDSDAVKNDLQQFLDRQNHLSQLVRSKPQMAAELVSSLGQNVKEARKRRALQSYNELLSALDAPPVTILYASDGGAAEKVAKKLSNRAKARGLSTTLATLDSMPLDSLAQEEYVFFVTSTAGQGEPPQNGRHFFKALNAAVGRGDQILTNLKYGVFGMGDSHYWPRPEDAHYYNKPGKDLDSRLAALGGQRIVDLGLGDDQDADGPQTGYKLFEPAVWKIMGVDSIEVTEAEPEPITNEHIKAASQYLRGTIVEGLEDTSTGAIAPSDGQLTKFHGIYQQDDRDIREEREAQGVEPAYSFMIRVRMPGGVCTPQQWLQMDQISDEHGCGTFKITTRATFQFHGVIKRHLKPAIQDINRVLLDTLAACGDVNRFVFLPSTWMALI